MQNQIASRAGFTLAHLPLLGAGSSRTESLASYVLRLAHAHGYRPNDFIKLLAPLSGQAERDAGQWIGQFLDTRFSDEASVLACWVPLLEQLTGVSGLAVATLGTWGSLLTRRGSDAVVRQWCPHCLEDGHRSGGAHMHLLWSVGLVQACPHHGTELESVCPHCGAGRTPSGRPAKRFAMHAPGVCASCGGWLGTVDPRQPQASPREIPQASNHAVCVAEQIGTLIARPLGPEESLRVHCTLNVAKDRYFGGSMVELARWIGLGKSTVHGWLSGEVVPELRRLVELALKLRVPLGDLVRGCTDSLPLSLTSGSAGLKSYVRAEPRPDEKRADLRQLFETRPDLSIREMARLLGMNPRDVYYYEPELARAHSDARRMEQSEAREAVLDEAAQGVMTHLARVESVGECTTVRDLRAAAANEAPSLSYADQQRVVTEVLKDWAA
ncbi:TniQ family protein [Rivibacter subsaxonicus]|uniref:TniQ protein n=1 Tax=Rivibacter subsaxonicus TaxID=457575 RepID=A0A4Q7VNK6_9BURK|nr:TniQ family protein [Rivibacter subsaxonicus]RZT97804.1 TniQ protein [Rivibacter subsaxonicus]